jgi:hypothetical protein
MRLLRSLGNRSGSTPIPTEDTSQMLSKTSTPPNAASSHRQIVPTLLTPALAAHYLSLSVSWLAKRRLAGDGPPYVKLGGAVRYAETSLQQWMKSRQRLSTSEV